MGCPCCRSVLHALHFSCQTSLLKLGLNRQRFVLGTRLEDDGLPRVVSQQHCCHGFRISTSSSDSFRKYRCKDIGSLSRAQQVLAQGHRYLDGDGDGETCEALR
mgnify:FL=1